MKEFNNRQIADQHAEYITGQALRKYAAEKVKKYVPNLKTIFDGAAGSGQLEQFINAEKIIAVEIQKQAADTLLENFPNSEVHVMSFFLFDEYKEYDASLINPPFSLKFKEQTKEEIEAIQSEFPWKKSGVLDDIFLLKSLNFTKRYGFYILFPGIAYRKAEKKMRELVGNRLLELNFIENGFEDTSIPVIFIVLDKEKTENTYASEICSFSSPPQVKGLASSSMNLSKARIDFNILMLLILISASNFLMSISSFSSTSLATSQCSKSISKVSLAFIF